jgi:prepilin-type N-terminal cleavage/methylation domain-containing protein
VRRRDESGAAAIYSPPFPQHSFTLIEMLVVIAIIGILAAMLMPSLMKARIRAMDTNCQNTVKQTILAVVMYNNDYRSGLQNFNRTCAFLGQGWSTAHLANLTCLTQEGRSGGAFWRAYLLSGRYLGALDPNNGTATNAELLGCPVRRYPITAPNGVFARPYSNAIVNTWVEGANAPTRRTNPDFVWYGPGIAKSSDVMFKAGGNLFYDSPTGSAGDQNNFWRAFSGAGGYSRWRFPLFTCPQIMALSSPEEYELPHRQNWGRLKKGGPVIGNVPTNEMSAIGFAGSIGFSDGSVRFRELNIGHAYNPLTRQVTDIR